MSEPRFTVQEAIELQRGALAAEIHDSLLPYLFATRMRLETLLSRIQQSGSFDGAKPRANAPPSEDAVPGISDYAPHELQMAVQTLQDAMTIGRELISQLYPADMTISWRLHLRNAFERLSAYETSHLVIEGDLEDWIRDPEQRLAARRIAQEAVRNAVRHGKASEIEVVVSQENDREIQVLIRDNGIGFEPMVNHQGFGLRIMQMRASQVGATISIESQAGGPTSITLRMRPQDAAVAD